MPYLGIDLQHAFLMKDAGYINTTFRFGSHIRQGSLTQGSVSLGILHISNIRSKGDIRFRIFTGINYSLGINRLSYDSLYLRNGSGIVGLRTDYFRGMQRANAVIQLLYYSPWKIIGFSFTPYLDISGGFIGEENTAIFKTRFISGIGFGIRMRNDYLVFSSIQLRLMYFPYTPHGVAAWSVDISDITDYSISDFKPGAPQNILFR